MAKITEIWFICSQYRRSARAIKGLTLAVCALALVTARSWYRCFFQWDSPFPQGAGMAEGSNWCRLYHHSGFNQYVRHIDCNMPLLSTKEKPQWFVLSGVVRFIPDYDRCVFLSAVFYCWHGKSRNGRRIVQVFSHLWISMTNIRLYLTNCCAVSLYKLRKFFGKCKWWV